MLSGAALPSGWGSGAIKVVHVNTTESQGGASRAAHRLYTGQRKLGVDARMLVLKRSTNDPYVDSVPMNRLQRLNRRSTIHLERPSKRAYPQYRGGVWSTGRVSSPVSRYLERTLPDVVNLHWLGNGMLSVEALAKIRAPVVWTLHDMWAVTGGCHYTAGCVKYRTGCGACPILGSTHAHDISARTWERKQRTWKDLDLTIVAPSRWLAEVVRESPILGGYRIEVIPNGIDTQVFRPFDTAFARDVLRLPLGKRLILFGAQQIEDERKGFVYLSKALASLSGRDDVELVLFGAQKPTLDTDLRSHHVGTIDNDQILALLYSAADIFVAPSVQDNLPNTVMEALLCGTPCVGFNVGGMPDLIDHQVSGYLARPFDTEDLARGIAWVLENRATLSVQAHTRSAERFNLSQAASRYLELYDELLTGVRERLPN